MPNEPYKSGSAEAPASTAIRVPPIQSLPASDMEALVALYADLETAVAEYALRHFGRVTRALEEMRRNMQFLQGLSPELETERVFMEGCLFCLEGRVYTSSSKQEEANEAFKESIKHFESRKIEIQNRRKGFFTAFISALLPAPGQERQMSSTRVLTDYGIALMRIGRIEDATVLLQEICAGFAPPPEAFSYLGRAHEQAKKLPDAEKALRRGLMYAKHDPKLLQYLAETLKDAGNGAEAARIYYRAARAALRVEDLKSAAEMAQQAIELDPEMLRAADLAFYIASARNDGQAAQRVVDHVLNNNPGQPWALGKLGSLLKQEGKLPEAIETLRQVSAKEPEFFWIYAELADALYKHDSKNVQEALVLIDRAIELAPRSAQAWHMRARFLVEVGKLDDALSSFGEAEKFGPPSATFFPDLGRAYLLKAEYSRAEGAYNRALKQDGHCIAALFGKAQVYRAQEDRDKALYCVKKALRQAEKPGQTEPADVPELFHWMIDLLVEMEDTESALEQLDSRIETEPECGDLYLRKGQILRSRGELKEAVPILQEAVRLKETTAALFELADTFRQMKNYEEAGKLYRRRLELSPDSPGAQFYLALYLAEIAEFAAASELLERAIEKTPNKGWLWGLQGWCFEYQGPEFLQRALRAYEAACEYAGEGEDTLWYKKGRANALIQLHQVDDGKKLCREIVTDTQGNSSEVLQALGWCYYRLQENDEGIRLLNAALLLDENAGTIFDLGLVFLSSNRTALANTEYKRGIRVVSGSDKLRGRGFCYVALYDLHDAVSEKRVEESAAECVSKWLQEKLKELDMDVASFTWLKHEAFKSGLEVAGQEEEAVACPN